MTRPVMILAGGTGGHVLPAVNFFKYLRKKNKKVYILSDYRGSNFINNLDQNLDQINFSIKNGYCKKCLE